MPGWPCSWSPQTVTAERGYRGFQAGATIASSGRLPDEPRVNQAEWPGALPRHRRGHSKPRQGQHAFGRSPRCELSAPPAKQPRQRSLPRSVAYVGSRSPRLRPPDRASPLPFCSQNRTSCRRQAHAAPSPTRLSTRVRTPTLTAPERVAVRDPDQRKRVATHHDRGPIGGKELDRSARPCRRRMPFRA
jgi:hypothetical protein